eukprot:1180247-Prorocentrum_minimum.AAC.2
MVKVAPPNIDCRFSLLDRAVSVLRNPEDRHLEPLDRAKRIDNQYLVALLLPFVSAVTRLLRYVCEELYPELLDRSMGDDPTAAARGLVVAVAKRTGALAADWEALGLVHGVLNTDNIAVSGETIDLGGSFGFAERFSRNDFTPNAADTEGRYTQGIHGILGLNTNEPPGGRRYSQRRQPAAALEACLKLAEVFMGEGAWGDGSGDGGTGGKSTLANNASTAEEGRESILQLTRRVYWCALGLGSPLNK